MFQSMTRYRGTRSLFIWALKRTRNSNRLSRPTLLNLKSIFTQNKTFYYCTSTTSDRYHSYTKDTTSLHTDYHHPQNSTLLDCSGCGTTLHCTTPNTQGYIPTSKLQSLLEQLNRLEVENNSNQNYIEPPICQRCFYLKHYNTALDVTLQPNEYKSHLAHLRDKRALVLCIVDVLDYPSSLFPSLHTVLGRESTIYLIGNKIDLLPDISSKTRTRLTSYLLKEAASSLGDLQVSRVDLVSAKTKLGLDKLTSVITKDWGNRGDVYLFGCTNVGKSSLFNYLLCSLCGVRPGQATTVNRLPAPSPTVSHWPGTTLGLLKFPMMSIGKRNRLMERARRQGRELEDVVFNENDDSTFNDNDFTEVVSSLPLEETKQVPRSSGDLIDIKDILEEIGINNRKRLNSLEEEVVSELPPQNRHWVIDTPGAVNDEQIINYLTTKELNLFLPKKPLVARTVILKPGQTLFIGGLARLDYTEGPVSVYFTVFASSYLPLHTTKTDKAQEVYNRNLGKPLLKLPLGDDTQRLVHFPPLQSTNLTLAGIGWDKITSDIILSSVGWVGVTAREGISLSLTAHTLHGKGLYLRSPPLFPDAVNERGKRSKKGNRTMFMGKKNK